VSSIKINIATAKMNMNSEAKKMNPSGPVNVNSRAATDLAIKRMNEAEVRYYKALHAHETAEAALPEAESALRIAEAKLQVVKAKCNL
jgi:hypothetical protein